MNGEVWERLAVLCGPSLAGFTTYELLSETIGRRGTEQTEQTISVFSFWFSEVCLTS